MNSQVERNSDSRSYYCERCGNFYARSDVHRFGLNLKCTFGHYVYRVDSRWLESIVGLLFPFGTGHIAAAVAILYPTTGTILWLCIPVACIAFLLKGQSSRRRFLKGEVDKNSDYWRAQIGFGVASIVGLVVTEYIRFALPTILIGR
jgi:hypothetical protein